VSVALDRVTKSYGSEVHLQEVSLSFERGAVNVLLGRTLSGKTTLMRLLAGMDTPTSGRLLVEGQDVTGVPVRKRNVAMVYQQFINYPMFTVYENIASPLRIARCSAAEIERRVREAAELFHLEPFLSRRPLELSGGQQQRTAIARAMVKGASLVLLDEPLANLDYKLREELREELPRIFKETGAVLVYATADPTEALLLGGRTATLYQGRVTQFGPTLDVFRRPVDLVTANAFSDPPLNTMEVATSGGQSRLANGVVLAGGTLAGLADGSYIVGLRPHHVSLTRSSPDAIALKGQVTLSEITGSESYVHLSISGNNWVALTQGVHIFLPGSPLEFYIEPARLFVFDLKGNLAAAPTLSAAA